MTSKNLRVIYVGRDLELRIISLLVRANEIAEEVIFVEVKSRQAKDIDMAKHSVCKKKQRRIIITSQVYLQTMEPNAKYFRFDVIVLCKSSRRIKWYKNAFDVS